MQIGIGEIVVLTVGGSLLYLVLAALTGCLPIRHGGVRALAMALWPVTVVAVLIYLPFLIWWAANEPGGGTDNAIGPSRKGPGVVICGSCEKSSKE